MIRRSVNRVLELFGRRLQNISTFDLLVEERDALRELYLRLTQEENAGPELTPQGIVFSRNRPLQLDALIRSYLKLSQENDGVLHVIYKADNERYEKAYRQLFEELQSSRIIPHGEGSFQSDVRTTLSFIRSRTMFFLVDDILFLAPFSLRLLGSFDPLKYVPSLRLAEGQDYCYTRDKAQKVPDLRKTEQKGTSFITWCWSGEEHDWGFPLSLDGHLFDRREMEILLNHLEFSSPNSLENALQIHVGLFLPRLGVAYHSPRLINTPWNKVQTEVNNRSGSMTESELLGLWEEGKRIDIHAYAGTVAASTHAELPLRLTENRSEASETS